MQGAKQFLVNQINDILKKIQEMVTGQSQSSQEIVTGHSIKIDELIQNQSTSFNSLINNQTEKFSEVVTELKSSVLKQDSQITKLTDLVNKSDSQITKLTDLVGKSDIQITKLAEMVIKQDQAIPKFADISDEVKYTKKYNYVTTLKTNPANIIPFVSGKIRIKIRDVKNTGASYYYFIVKKNGVQVVQENINPTSQRVVIVDIAVNEGDLIELTTNDTNISIGICDICYMEVAKPGASLS